MPAVDVAMARSLRGGFLNLLAASLRPALESRDTASNVEGQITDVKTAFSSWDNCMQASYCKWPVIAIIIIGGLIVISIIWCIARCACCGLSCCCECCYCLKCCGECCGCCDPPRGKRHKYLDEPYIPPHHAEHHGYKSQAPMNSGPTFPATAPPPQYAEFDVAKRGGGNEDALPEMPSWETASSKKVMVEEEAVELDQLNQLKKPETNSQNVPLMTGAAVTPGPASPIHSPDHNSPYGPPAVHAASTGYSDAVGANGDPFAQTGQAYNDHNGVYDHRSPPPSVDRPHGMAGAAVATGRQSPQIYSDTGYGRGGAYSGTQPTQSDYDGSRRNPYDDYSQHGGQGYGMGIDRRSPPVRNPNVYDSGYGAARRSPAPRGDFGAARRSPAPRGEYGAARRSPGPQTDHSYAGNYGNGSYQLHEPGRPLRQTPQRQYSRDVSSSSSPPLQNNGGFDFSSGYSRPRSPPQQQQAAPQTAYPGYRAYQPNQ